MSSTPMCSSYIRVGPESNQGLDTFKGRLLGVEDDLIDAFFGEQYPSQTFGQETPDSHHAHSEGTLQGQVPEMEYEMSDGFDSAEDELADYFTDCATYSQATSATTNSESGLETEEQNTINPSQLNARFPGGDSMVTTNDQRLSNSTGEDDDKRTAYNSTVDSSLASARHHKSTPGTISRSAAPPSRGPDQPTTDVSSGLPDDFVVDSMLLERPSQFALLGSWDLGDWHAVGLAMG